MDTKLKEFIALTKTPGYIRKEDFMKLLDKFTEYEILELAGSGRVGRGNPYPAWLRERAGKISVYTKIAYKRAQGICIEGDE